MCPQRHHRGPRPTRRQLLVAGAATGLAATAGCTTVIDFMASHAFDLAEVNLFNDTSMRVRGRIEVLGPAGDTALDSPFDLAAPDAAGEESTAAFEDVWGDPGSYEVALELSETAIEGTTRASETVTLESPEEEMLGVPLGASADEPIDFRVGESFSELTDG